jgi:hypothetical protein
MKKYLIVLVFVFLLLSGTTVFAQNKQTGVKKELDAQSGQTDKLLGKKIQQKTLSDGRYEKLDTISSVNCKAHKKALHKKKKHYAPE